MWCLWPNQIYDLVVKEIHNFPSARSRRDIHREPSFLVYIWKMWVWFWSWSLHLQVIWEETVEKSSTCKYAAKVTLEHKKKLLSLGYNKILYSVDLQWSTDVTNVCHSTLLCCFFAICSNVAVVRSFTISAFLIFVF